MHRIRLHSQWKRDTSAEQLSRFFRSFHSPTGLTEGDRVFLTASAAAQCSTLHDSFSIQLNGVPLTAVFYEREVAIELTPYLQKFNRLQLDLFSTDTLNATANPLWPLENLALEIHPQTKTD